MFKGNGIIRIKIAYPLRGREFRIEDLEGNQIKPIEWPEKYEGRVFQLVEKGGHEAGEIKE